MKKLFLMLSLIFSIHFGQQASGQEKDARGYYLVEAEKFTPPIKDLIASFEGRVAEGFLASDIYGTEHFLTDYRGKTTFLFFWNLESETGRILYDKIKIFYQTQEEKLHVIGMAINKKSSLLQYFGDEKTCFPIIPNGEVFGQMAYGADLGSPRLFAVDDKGIIVRVIPAAIFLNGSNIPQILEETLNATLDQ